MKKIFAILWSSISIVGFGQECVDINQIDLSIMCTQVWEPVCGCDGETYTNSCVAQFTGGVTSFTDGPCLIIEEFGCTYIWACNFNPNALVDDGSCVFPPVGCEFSSDTPGGGCTYSFSMNYDPEAIWEDGSCLFGANPCPSDLNGDGLITIADLMILLAGFGTVC